MKNRKVLIFLFTLIALLSLYRFDFSVAMANTWNGAEAAVQPDYVSTGAELTQWLESHKRTGGIVKLTDNVVLDGYYCFSHDRINLPSIFVDAGRHTITVTGEAEFWSDKHLIFQGQGNPNGILRVSKGGLLTLSGITVQSGQGEAVPQYALWQEEGAGLVVDNCEVAGNIRYAETPYVINDSSVSVIVEKGQTAGDLLPSAIKCDVNYQGMVNHNELMQVSWKLKGTQMQQKERSRFYVPGTFSHADFREQPVCTVIYNDYPLTFTDVQAKASARAYLFRIWYTKPEEHLPIEVLAEYSFDGKNWVSYDKFEAESPSDGIFMGITSEQWNAAENPYIYLRLQWDNEGTLHYSNVLRYAADNLKNAEDQGGTRGGGTSIINPPDEPQNEGNPSKPDSNPGNSDNPGNDKNPDNNSNSGNDKNPENNGNPGNEKNPGNNSNPGNDKNPGDNSNPGNSDNPEDNNNPESSASPNDYNPPYIHPTDGNTGGQSPIENVNEASGNLISEASGKAVPETPEDIGSQASGEDAGGTTKEADSGTSVAAASVDGENDDTADIQETMPEPAVSQNKNMIIVLSFAAFCVIAGGMGFCFRAGIFRRLLRKVKRK